LAICQSIEECLNKVSEIGLPRVIFVESGQDVVKLADALRVNRMRTTLIAFGRVALSHGASAVEAGAAEFIAIPVEEASLD